MPKNELLYLKYDEMNILKKNSNIKEEFENIKNLKQENVVQRAEIQKLYEKKRSTKP